MLAFRPVRGRKVRIFFFIRTLRKLILVAVFSKLLDIESFLALTEAYNLHIKDNTRRYSSGQIEVACMVINKV